VHEFLRRISDRLQKRVTTVTPQAMTLLVDYAWPGNVRELEHAVERAVILARTSALSAKDLPPEIRDASPDGSRFPGLDLQATERVLVREALRRCDGSRKRAAAALGVSTVTLWRMMKRHNLTDARAGA
jgi:DNA-binding NtrC family response regulator